MTAVFPLLVVMLISWSIVQLGAVMYELTGMERRQAKFQSLSAFTGTGFTTREAESALSVPIRRRITSTLMVLGYGGTASVVATVLRSVEVETFKETALNISVMALVFASVWLVLSRHGRVVWFTDFVRRHLTKRMTEDRVPHEDLFSYKKGYGVTRIEVPRASKVVGKRLRDLDLRKHRLQVLAVEEDGGHEVLPVPHPDTILTDRQHLILYGFLAEVQDVFAPEDDEPTESDS
jgi:hypothetical protein